MHAAPPFYCYAFLERAEPMHAAPPFFFLLSVAIYSNLIFDSVLLKSVLPPQKHAGQDSYSSTSRGINTAQNRKHPSFHAGRCK